MEVRTEVLRFYNKHNRAKLAHVDQIMRAYEGRGEELLRQLREKYEPDLDLLLPGTGVRESANVNTNANAGELAFQDDNDENSNARSANTVVNRAAIKVPAAQQGGDILSSANAHGGGSAEEVLAVQLTPTQQQEALEKRIALLEFTLTFYSYYNTKNMANVDQIVDLYTGKEEELLLSLQQKYGLTEALTLDWRPPEPEPAAVSENEEVKEKEDSQQPSKANAEKTTLSLHDPSPMSSSPMAPRHEAAADADATAAAPDKQPDNWVPKTTVMESKPRSIFTLFKSKSAKSKEFFVAAETTERNASFGIFRRRASSSSETAVIMHL
jgi:hypothetical protein